MSFDTNQDEKLKQFLQNHRPSVPPPSPQLEARLLAQINRIDGFPQETSFFGRLSWPWLTGGLLAIAVLLGGGLHWRQTQMAREPDMEVLEAFLQETWVGTMEEGYSWSDTTMPDASSSPSQEWWSLTAPPSP
jgi:hypothetical protein